MLHINQEQLRKIQLIELEMLEEVDRICRKCDIHYNIIAGTLLGAVRHGGFIPWDDDADVAMLRKEYEKFRKACRTELDTERFEFQDHRNTDGYRWGYGKLRRKETLFIREFQESMPYFQGIFIDIFPLDGVPDNYLARTVQNFVCFCIRKILWAPVGFVKERNMLIKHVFSLLKKIPIQGVFKTYHYMIKLANQKNTSMVRILMYPTPNSEWGYLKCWYEKSEPISFEDRVFQGIADYDSYLRFKYGNYQEIPPAEKRKVHPVSELRL